MTFNIVLTGKSKNKISKHVNNFVYINSFLQENSLTGGVLLGEWLRSLSSDQKHINTDIGFTPVTLYVIQLSDRVYNVTFPA
jgi:hypothetical protein